MATTPRPQQQQQQHRSSSRFPPFPSALTDTPTPLSSQQHGNSIHSNSMLHHQERGGGGSFNKSKQQSTSRPLKPLSSITSRLNNHHRQHSISTSGDSLGGVEAIEPDDTELERKEHELSFERMMKELQDARISSSSSASESDGGSKRGFRDEQDDFTSSSSSQEDDEEEDGSIRIGLSGIRYNSTRHQEQLPQQQQHEEEEEEEHDSDELTYLTIPRSQLDPTSPAKPRQPPLLNRNSKPSFLSTFSPPKRFSSSPPPVVQTIQKNQNQNQYRSSPLNPLQNSPILATTTSTTNSGNHSHHSRSRSISSSPSNTLLVNDGGRPVTIEEVSDKGTPPRSQRSQQTQPQPQPQTRTSWSTTRGGGRERERSEGVGGGGVRLPDMTFLTEALESPVKIPPPPSSSLTSKKVAADGRSSSNNSGGGGTNKSSSKEAPLITGALSSLTSKLTRLEKENQTSSLRVQELESQLSKLQQQQQRLPLPLRQSPSRERRAEKQQEEEDQKKQKVVIEEKVRKEMFELLKGERERRFELENLVSQLQFQFQQQQQQQQQQTRTIPTTAVPSKEQQEQKERESRRAKEVACSTALELKDEVKDLRFGLQTLGYEVEGVRTVVESLLRDKELDLKETRWSLEEEERRKTLIPPSVKQQQERGTDERPDTPRSENGSSRTSFISAEEIERLRKEQEIEFSRRTPTRKPSSSSSVADHHHHYSSRSRGVRGGGRKRRALSISSSYDSEQDSTYSPSSLQSSISTAASTASTILTAPSSTSEEAEVEEPIEPDFERAEKIFKDVERVERRERRERLKEEREKLDKRARTRGGEGGGEGAEEKSEELCKKCLGKKRLDETREKEQEVFANALRKEKEREREREREKERIEREKEKERLRIEKEKAREKKKVQEREMHCRTLQAVLERLEDDFASQKKIYLELTVEYQSMSSRTSTKKRKALADHLKLSIDVLEEKAKEVKQYADALEDLYHSNLTKSSQHHHH